jgi:hypothetical protein
MKQKSGRGKTQQKTPLQKAGGQFIDHLGKAAVDKLKVKLGLNTETKFLYEAIGASVLGTTLGQAMANPVIAQGAAFNQRVGASLRVTRVRYQFSIASASTTTGACAVRVIFAYKDKDVGGVAIAANQVLQTTSDSNSLPAFSLKMKATGIRVLFDKTYYLGVPASDNAVVCDHFDWKPETFDIEYASGDTTGVIADVIRGDIEMFAMLGSVAGTLGTAPSIAIDRCTEFVDN